MTADYVVAVLTLYLDLSDTPLRPSPLDQSLARKLHQQSGPLPLIESALLLATLRRFCRPSISLRFPRSARLPTSCPSSTNSSSSPFPDGYLDYLRLKLRISLPTRPDVQKNTFSDDR